jgi:hypothetical protein
LRDWCEACDEIERQDRQDQCRIFFLLGALGVLAFIIFFIPDAAAKTEFKLNAKGARRRNLTVFLGVLGVLAFNLLNERDSYGQSPARDTMPSSRRGFAEWLS